EDAHYANFANGHTIAITEESGFAFIAGSNTCPAPTATGALHIIDIRNPLNPVFAGCVVTGGYSHEAQCWIYHGPDTAHQGKEICFNFNGSSGNVAIVDVTNKAAPITLSSNPYAGSRFTHQGWLTEDHRYLLVNDELDETQVGHNARTYVWNVSNLDAPTLVGFHQHALPVIDHNLYVHGNYVFESNYEAGLRILRLDNLTSSPPVLTEVAFFDTYPAAQSPQFNGNWNNYRFERSGVVIASGIDEGFYVLQPRLCTPPATPNALSASGNGTNRIDLAWTGSGQPGANFQVERAQGGCDGAFQTLAAEHPTAAFNDTTASGQTTYGYRVSERNGAVCTSVASACVSASSTGACTAPPVFDGIAAAINSGHAQCRIDLSWPVATGACGSGANFEVYRDTNASFAPGNTNRIADALSSVQYSDVGLSSGGEYHYVVRARDVVSGAAETNQRTASARVSGPVVPGTFSAGAEPGDPGFDEGSSPTTMPGKSVASPKHAGWHPASDRKRTGNFSFWSTRANNLCVSLVSPSISLQSGGSPTLSFWQAFSTQAGQDGGVVEISTDGGGTWARLTPLGGYPDTISGTETLCGIAPGAGAVTGSNGLAFAQTSVNLSAYAGQSVRLRWLYRSNAATNPSPGGWYVDDVTITQAMVPGPCVITLPDPVFNNGFEN
ncbi:MAG: choice-of-anchor B family protein, partial [Pseudomonadota bacterium]|nr:choice-of-anchor B family protein [Pseudomonadota bacterium]